MAFIDDITIHATAGRGGDGVVRWLHMKERSWAKALSAHHRVEKQLNPLNPRDRAFSVTEFDALITAAGLRIACWVEPLRYDPDVYLPDPRLRARTALLSPLERAALAEAICGNMGIHIVYVVRADDPPLLPPWDDPNAVPVLREWEGEKLARGLPPSGVLPVGFDGLTVNLALPRLASAILARMDGKRRIGAIGDLLAAQGITREAFARDFAELARQMERLNRLLLAAPS